MSTPPLKLGFVGIGTMGGMLVRALLRSRRVNASDLWVANRSTAKLESLLQDFPGLNPAEAPAVAAEAETLFLCVKPADTPLLLQQIEHKLRGDQTCVFLTNVFSFSQLETCVPCRTAKFIPSIAQQIGRGVAPLACGPRMGSDTAGLEDLLNAICRPLVVPESQLRILADITSCGPALLAACIDELCRQAGQKTPALSSATLIGATVEMLGATVELLRSGIGEKELTQRVAVPGGTTEAGLYALRQHLPQAIAAVLAATAQAEREKGRLLSLDYRQ